LHIEIGTHIFTRKQSLLVLIFCKKYKISSQDMNAICIYSRVSQGGYYNLAEKCIFSSNVTPIAPRIT